MRQLLIIVLTLTIASLPAHAQRRPGLPALPSTATYLPTHATTYQGQPGSWLANGQEVWEYDAAGNYTSFRYIPNTGAQSIDTVRYDAYGHMVFKAYGTPASYENSTNYSYTYDAQNRIVAARTSYHSPGFPNGSLTRYAFVYQPGADRLDSMIVSVSDTAHPTQLTSLMRYAFYYSAGGAFDGYTQYQVQLTVSGQPLLLINRLHGLTPGATDGPLDAYHLMQQGNIFTNNHFIAGNGVERRGGATVALDSIRYTGFIMAVSGETHSLKSQLYGGNWVEMHLTDQTYDSQGYITHDYTSFRQDPSDVQLNEYTNNDYDNTYDAGNRLQETIQTQHPVFPATMTFYSRTTYSDYVQVTAAKPALASELTLYPNPATSTCISIAGLPAMAPYAILDSKGAVAQTGTVNALRVNISKLSPGLYRFCSGSASRSFVRQ